MSVIYAVHLRHIGAAEMVSLWAAASERRRERANRFVFEADQRRCLAAGELLAHVLARHGVTRREIELAENTHGKPYLVHRPDLHFNVSHSGDWVVCAVGPEELGVDVERCNPDAINVARRFAPEEFAYIHGGACPEERTERFTEVWTLKESYVKFLGRGLAVALNAYSVSVEGQRSRLLRGVDGRTPFLRQIPHGEGYSIAYCGGDGSDLAVELVPQQELLGAAVDAVGGPVMLEERRIRRRIDLPRSVVRRLVEQVHDPVHVGQRSGASTIGGRLARVEEQPAEAVSQQRAVHVGDATQEQERGPLIESGHEVADLAGGEGLTLAAASVGEADVGVQVGAHSLAHGVGQGGVTGGSRDELEGCQTETTDQLGGVHGDGLVDLRAGGPDGRLEGVPALAAQRAQVVVHDREE